jgi:hypothetical protein
MPTRDRSIAQLAGDLEALAERLIDLEGAGSRDLVTEPAIEAIRESNAEIWRTKGRALGQPWGSYSRRYEHPLQKNRGDQYWLIDEDYFTRDGLRSSLVQLGRSSNSRLLFFRDYVEWFSTIFYAARVNQRYGTIYGITPRGRAGIRRAMVARLREMLFPSPTDNQ